MSSSQIQRNLYLKPFPAIIYVGVLVWSLVALPSFASTYFIDSQQGNDLWSGHQQNLGQADGPWRSTQNLANIVLAPGDEVLFKCDGQWSKPTTQINQSGTRAKAIRFGSYGDCTDENKPVLKGSELVGDWVVHSGNIYVTQLTYKAKELFFNGDYSKPAQFPNSGYLMIDSDSIGANEIPSRTFLTDAELGDLPEKDLIGAGIHIRTINWRIEDRTIQSFDVLNRTISWPQETNYVIRKAYGYYLVNKLWMLDQAGEWYYDATEQKLYFWPPNNQDPNQSVVEATRYDVAFQVRNQDNIIIEDLTIAHYDIDGLRYNYGDNYLFRNLTITGIGGTAININQSTNGRILENKIINNVRDGIKVRTSENIQIIANLVENTATLGSPKNSFAAIYAVGKAYTINNNIVRHAAYIGIRYGFDSEIKNNIIENVCLVLDDCGGIHVWNYQTPKIPSNSKVIDNIIINAIGNPEGRPSAPTLAAGIYLDDLASFNTLKGNTIINTDRGIFLHNTHNNVIEKNTLYANRHSQLSASENGRVTPGVLTGNTVKKNIMLSTSTLIPVDLQSIFNNNNFARFEKNIYWSLYSPIVANIIYRPNYPVNNNVDRTFFNFAGWQNYQMDIEGTLFSPFRINPFRLIEFNGAENISNGVFDTGVSRWRSWSAMKDHVVSWETNCIIGNGCLRFDAGSSASLLISPRFSIVKDRTYIVSFDIAGTTQQSRVEAVVRRDGPNYQSYGLAEFFLVDANWQNKQLLLTAKDTTNLARFDIQLNANETVLLDNISIKEAQVEINHSKEDSQILINKTQRKKKFPCPDDSPDGKSIRCSQYISLSGEQIQWPLKIDPFQSRILIWNNSPFKQN